MINILSSINKDQIEALHSKMAHIQALNKTRPKITLKSSFKMKVSEKMKDHKVMSLL